MANMSYCRFQNTATDLFDCQLVIEDDPSELSKEEQRARVRLIKMCLEIADAFKDDETANFDQHTKRES